MSGAMKVLMVLSKLFIHDTRVYNEAKALVDSGAEVTVVVWDRRGECEPEIQIDGIRVIRIANSRGMQLLPNDVLRNPVWWRKAYRKGLELYRTGFCFDVVHCHDLDTLRAGVWLKKKLGCKLIYDAHEIFGYMVLDVLPSFLVKLTFFLEKRLLKHVDQVITVNDPVCQYLKSITNHPITIVMNCKDLISDSFQPPDKNHFTVCYFGILSKSRMFPDLVDILGGIEGVRFLIAGKKTSLYEAVQERSQLYENVEFLGSIPFEEVIPRTVASNAILCMFDPHRLSHRIGLPNKVFEAMVTGRPIIVTKGMYYSDEFVEKERCGLSVSNDGDGVRAAIMRLRDHYDLQVKLGKNGFQAAKERYNWEVQRKHLLKVYEVVGS